MAGLSQVYSSTRSGRIGEKKMYVSIHGGKQKNKTPIAVIVKMTNSGVSRCPGGDLVKVAVASLGGFYGISCITKCTGCCL